MPGERWSDKRARAVLYAGARKAQQAATTGDPDAIAEAGLAVRELLFTDAEVREENADVKAHRIGYSADCMQFATLEPGPEGVLLGLWLGECAPQAEAELGASRDPNPLRAHFGWVRVPLTGGADSAALAAWVQRARAHAAQTKGQQAHSL